MRRNVRRLNREVNDGQPNHQHVIENGKDTVAVDNTSAPRKGRSRKAANLAELQRYFTAAADAAAEVGMETAPSPDSLHANAPSTAQAVATGAVPAVLAAPSGAPAAGLVRPPLAPPTAPVARVPAPGAAIDPAGASAAGALVPGAQAASSPAAASLLPPLPPSAHGKVRAVVKTEPDAMDAATANQLAQAGVKPLHSPRYACARARARADAANISMNLLPGLHLLLPAHSRMVAANLASGSAAFREKLREKLEATGGVACKINIGGPSARKEGKTGEESEKGSRRCVTQS